MKEEKFLKLIRETLPESAGRLEDDTAYIPEKELILTQDTLIEDIHFRTRTISPFFLGRKAIAVNLSDIAASGGIPFCVLISLSMSKNIDEKFIKEFYKGIHSICREYGVFVAGGDLTAAEKITISVCAVGNSSGHPPANRKNAQPGDVVITTGNFGSSAAGLYLLEDFYKETGFSQGIPEKTRTKFISSHINPVPRVKEGRKILEIAEKPAVMDASDGLADALYKISSLSKVDIEVDFEQIPFDPDLLKIFQDEKTVKNQILFGGEDYELVAAVSEQAYLQIKEEIFVKKIGVVKKIDKTPCACVKFKGKKRLTINSEVLNSGIFKHFE